MNNTNEMLTAVVKRGVGRGAFKESLEEMGLGKEDCIIHITEKKIFIGDGGLILIREINGIADLITNKGFMGSVYGEECPVYNKKCIDGYCSAYPDNENCPDRSYLYHGIEAYKLLLTKGADEAIEYLYENMPEEGEDEVL